MAIWKLLCCGLTFLLTHIKVTTFYVVIFLPRQESSPLRALSLGPPGGFLSGLCFGFVLCRPRQVKHQLGTLLRPPNRAVLSDTGSLGTFTTSRVRA